MARTATKIEDADQEFEQPLTTRMAVCHLKSASPYSQSKHIADEPREGENPIAFEQRCWKQRLHVNSEGFVYIPPTAFSQSIAEAAKFLSMPIPGKARQTFTKHFESGVRVVEPLVLPIRAEDVQAEALFVHSNGKRGPGPRVTRYYPRIDSWEGNVTYWVFDAVVTEEAFARALQASGTLIGIGRFRPRNLGFYGRFEVLNINWSR